MSTKDVEYGYVTVVKGEDQGSVFYYDDDDHDEYEYDGKRGTGSCAILYPDQFVGGTYIRVPHKGDYFRSSTAEEVADHILAGKALWGSGSPRIFRDILIADVKHAMGDDRDTPEPENDVTPRDIIADTKSAMEAVLDAPAEKKREALLWLGVLVTTWIGLIDEETGNTPESAEIRKKARRALGKKEDDDVIA